MRLLVTKPEHLLCVLKWLIDCCVIFVYIPTALVLCLLLPLSALIKIRNVFSDNIDNITYCEAIIEAGNILTVDCCSPLV